MKESNLEFNNTNNQIEILKELVKPLQEWLIKNYNPMASIIINDFGVKVIVNELFIPKDCNK